MLITIENVLSKTDLKIVSKYILDQEKKFEEGTKTAGWHAKQVKNNEQLPADLSEAVAQKVAATLGANPVFAAAARPKRIVKLLVSRYRPGMEYGLHVDDALMDGVRTDLSFTLFLSDPKSYDGGELVIAGNDGETEIKLAAGSLVLYATTSLHKVAPVTRGERLAVVGWVRSLIRGTDEREVLFDLENALALARQAGADRAMIDRMVKVKANLLRLWAED